MLKVEVQSKTLRDLPFKDRDGNPIQEQQAWAFFYDRDGNIDQHPRSIALRMAVGQTPYNEGTYWIHPSSLYSGDYGSLKVTATIRLIPHNEFGKFINSLIAKPVQAAA